MNTAQIVITAIFLILNFGSILSLSYQLRKGQNIAGMIALFSSFFVFVAFIANTIALNKQVKSKGCPEYEQIIVPRLEKVVEVQDTLYKLKQ